MILDDFFDTMLPAIEEEMQGCVALANGPGLEELHHMMAYHLGWEGEGAGPQASGKRVRPMLVLLSCEAAGGKWQEALPAAAAVELIHNFSLIHDDIQDDSALRRGRPTVWKKWNIAQAINAGDSMFALAHVSLQRLDKYIEPAVALKAARVLPQTSLELTQGQYLDLDYETRENLSVDDYWPMVNGKTAALLAACTQLGALVAGVDEATQEHYCDFGEQLGLAFQAYDDLLGIWGDAALTGKSAASDLISGKKSLPVLYALAKEGDFAQRWEKGPISTDEVAAVADQLEVEGARQYTQDAADRLTGAALESLESALPAGDAAEGLAQLAQRLVKREV